MRQPLPKPLEKFEKAYPEVWQAFSRLGEKCHESGGPLDEKTRRLVKLALAIGTRHEGAVHSAVRQARQAGLKREEMMHVAILAITTVGWPAAFAAVTWVEESLQAEWAKTEK